MARNPEAISSILVFSGAFLFVVAAAASIPPSTELTKLEKCVKLVFNAPADPLPPSMNKVACRQRTFLNQIDCNGSSLSPLILCRDWLRMIGKQIRVTGEVPPDYLHSLEKLPEFRNDRKKLEKFLCNLSGNKSSGCHEKSWQLPG